MSFEISVNRDKWHYIHVRTKSARVKICTHVCVHTHTHTHSCILNVRVVSQGMQKNNKMADVLHTKETETYMCSVDCIIL